jgi:Transposase IS116/IS110/IS902 family
LQTIALPSPSPYKNSDTGTTYEFVINLQIYTLAKGKGRRSGGDDMLRRQLVEQRLVDMPARFRKSKSVGAVFGLTCSKDQSGEMDRSGRISRCGDEMMRVMLYEAAQSMLWSKKWSWLKAWAMQIARRRGMKKAIVALARRLAVIMHAPHLG